MMGKFLCTYNRHATKNLEMFRWRNKRNLHDGVYCVYYCSVEEVYQNQKKLEAESKQLQVHAGN